MFIDNICDRINDAEMEDIVREVLGVCESNGWVRYPNADNINEAIRWSQPFNGDFREFFSDIYYGDYESAKALYKKRWNKLCF